MQESDHEGHRLQLVAEISDDPGRLYIPRYISDSAWLTASWATESGLALAPLWLRGEEGANGVLWIAMGSASVANGGVLRTAHRYRAHSTCSSVAAATCARSTGDRHYFFHYRRGRPTALLKQALGAGRIVLEIAHDSSTPARIIRGWYSQDITAQREEREPLLKKAASRQHNT